MGRGALGLLVSLAAVLAFAGCGDDDRQDTDPLVEFEVEGGLAGFGDRITIDPDGRVRHSGLDSSGDSEPVLSLSDSQLIRLREVLEDVPFESLDDRYHSGDVADDLRYRIAYRDHELEVDLSVAPPELRPLLRRLGSIHSRTLR